MHYTLLDSYGFSCHQHAEDALLASGYRAQRTTHRSCYGDGASGSGEMVLRAVYGREREIPSRTTRSGSSSANCRCGEGRGFDACWASLSSACLQLQVPWSCSSLGAGHAGSTAVLLSLRLVPVRRSSAKRRLSQRMRPRTYSSAQLLNVTQHGLAHRLCA